jgi:hypothetical protein
MTGEAATQPELEPTSGLRFAVLVLWPSFLAACMLEALVFSMVDPGEIHWPGQLPQPSRQTIYTLAFFLFWLITASCSALAVWLAKPQARVNAEGLSDTPGD